MKSKILLSLIVATLSFSCNPFKNNEVNKVVYNFYKNYKGNYTNADRGLLTVALSDLIEKAATEEIKSVLALKAKKLTDRPAKLEGDIFTSLFESYTSFDIGKTTINGDLATVTVEFTNNKGGSEKWKDVIELIKEDGSWKIDNVQFKDERSVGKNTKEVLSQFLTPVTPVASDADDQRCRLSAGNEYQWSNIKKGCIRVFELPLKLKSKDRRSIATVIFSDDQKRAEVFTNKTSWVLSKKSGTAYESEISSEGAFLEKNNNRWELGQLKDGRIIYSE